MDLTPYIDRFRQELMAAAGAHGEQGVALADRLSTTLKSSMRLTLLDVLSEAMLLVSRELTPASVAVRLHGLEPEFEVTRPRAGQPYEVAAPLDDSAAPGQAPATPAGHIRLKFPDTQGARLATALFPAATADPEAHTLYIPSDGDLPTLRTVLATLDGASLDVEALTVHTGALADVFHALTGSPEQRDDDPSAPTQTHS